MGRSGGSTPASGRATLLAVLGVIAAACAHAPPSPDSREIDALTIEGTQALSASEIKERIVTSESSCVPGWFPFFGRTGWLDLSAWQGDQRRVIRLYEASGYYQARILEEKVLETRPGHVELFLKLREGLPATVSQLSVTGLDALDPSLRAKLERSPPLSVGDVFREDRWLEAKSGFTTGLREAGYVEVEVDGQAHVDADAARVEATLAVTPGQRYHFGRVFVATEAGATVPGSLIADVAAADIEPAHWYSESALLDAQARIFQMGVFSAVKVNRGAPDRDAATVPVVVDVREAPFHSQRVSVGVSGDTFRQEVRVMGEYTDRDLGFSRLFSKDARLDRLTLKAKLGWAFLPNVVAVATSDPDSKTGPTARLLAEYQVPRLLGLRTVDLQTSIDLSRALDAAFDYWGAEARLGVIWRPWVDVAISPSLNFDTYLLNTEASVRDNTLAALGCPRWAACIISFVEVAVQLDRRDKKLEPREGYYLGLSLQGGLFSSSQVTPYFRAVPEARGYLSFGEAKKVTLAGKLKLGTLISAGTPDATPVVARFFSGGSDMRGFNLRRLAPQRAVSTVPPEKAEACAAAPATADCEGGTFPVGGNGLIEASIELRWNLWGDLVLAVFNDWGLVTTAPLGPKTDLRRSLYTAVGIGVRYITPLGPVRLDLGVRLPGVGGPLELPGPNEPGYSGVYYKSSPGCFFGAFAPPPIAQDTAMGYSGSPEGMCALHLSIGEAF
jgi:translocation and assembly module TamA